MTTRTSRTALLSLAIATTLLLAACGGSQASDDDGGVASLAQSETTASEATASESPTDAEEAMLAYVECLRGQGLDIPDPQVNADGGLEMRIGGPGGGDGEPVDPEEFGAAREVCGEPPRAPGGRNADPERQAEFQDAALAFAQCMRDRGYDVPDPEFEGEGGVIFRGGGPGQDANDPEQQAAAEECQEQTFGNLQPGGGPRADGDGS